MTEIRKFDVGDIISIADGRLLSRRHVDGVYDILNYMTGDTLFTHQLPRANRVCEPYIREQHPDLADVGEIPEFVGTREEKFAQLDFWLNKFGEPREVHPLPEGVWNQINPIEEACDILGPEKVWVV